MDGLVLGAIVSEGNALPELIAVVVVGSILYGMWWIMKQLRKHEDDTDESS